MSVHLDFAAVGRILAAVTGDESTIPDIYQRAPSGSLASTHRDVRKRRSSLSFEISWAFEKVFLVETLGNDVSTRRRFETLGKISKHARAMQLLISGDPTIWPAIRNQLPDESILRSSSPEHLQELRTAAESERRRLRQTGLDQTSPLKELRDQGEAGRPALIQSLAKIYEEVFREPATVKFTSLWEAEGGFVRFSLAVFREAGQETTAEAIRKAYERASHPDKGLQKS